MSYLIKDYIVLGKFLIRSTDCSKLHIIAIVWELWRWSPNISLWVCPAAQFSVVSWISGRLSWLVLIICCKYSPAAFWWWHNYVWHYPIMTQVRRCSVYTAATERSPASGGDDDSWARTDGHVTSKGRFISISVKGTVVCWRRGHSTVLDTIWEVDHPPLDYIVALNYRDWWAGMQGHRAA
jgi:hypothetical protein